jgi:hypothetical protein
MYKINLELGPRKEEEKRKKEKKAKKKKARTYPMLCNYVVSYDR